MNTRNIVIAAGLVITAGVVITSVVSRRKKKLDVEQPVKEDTSKKTTAPQPDTQPQPQAERPDPFRDVYYQYLGVKWREQQAAKRNVDVPVPPINPEPVTSTLKEEVTDGRGTNYIVDVTSPSDVPPVMPEDNARVLSSEEELSDVDDMIRRGRKHNRRASDIRQQRRQHHRNRSYDPE